MELRSIPTHFFISEAIEPEEQALLDDLVADIKQAYSGIAGDMPEARDERMLLDCAIEIMRMREKLLAVVETGKEEKGAQKIN